MTSQSESTHASTQDIRKDKHKERQEFQKGHRQRMREKFLSSKQGSLTELELLEMLLFFCIPRADAKPLAHKIIKEFKSIAALVNSSIEELRRSVNISEPTLCMIKLVKEMNACAIKKQLQERDVIDSWEKLVEYARAKIGWLKWEEFRVLYLDNKNFLICDDMQQVGTINQVAVYPREIIKKALECGAASVILMHNHPSGDVVPSRQDIELTFKIVAAAKAVGVKVHDHVIISPQDEFSFQSQGLI